MIPCANVCCIHEAPPASAVASEAVPSTSLPSPGLVMTGGSSDDHVFARLAAGVLGEEAFQGDGVEAVLAAIRQTDRFSSVTGHVEKGQIHVQLTPWPPLEDWTVQWQPQPPTPRIKRELFPGLRKGLIVGNAQLNYFESRATTHLQELGFPAGTVHTQREQGGKRLVFQVTPGAPALVKQVAFTGDPAPYDAATLISKLKVTPHQTLWTTSKNREALERLRNFFHKEKRYRAQFEIQYAPNGLLTLAKVEPGPIMLLEAKGKGIGWKSLTSFVPLKRAVRYSPELLEEGARRITKHLIDQGYLDATVTHQEHLLEGTKEKPEKVQIEYHLNPGKRYRLRDIRIVNNKEVDEKTLVKAAGVDRIGTKMTNLFKDPVVTLDLMKSIEERIKAHYLKLGFNDIALRRMPMEGQQKGDDKVTLVYRAREGTKRLFENIQLEVPQAWDALKLTDSLVMAFSDTPRPVSQKKAAKAWGESPEGMHQTYQSDRSENKGITAMLSEVTRRNSETRLFMLRFSDPLPLRKKDFAKVITSLRDKAASIGALNVQPALKVEPLEEQYQALITVPEVPLATLNRLVIQGASRTRALAISRANKLSLGTPVSPDAKGETQSNLASLNAFHSVELTPLHPPEEERSTQKTPEDWMLRLSEAPPWQFGAGFGYDKSQGYHFDFGAQRTNINGMGRVLDFGIRAGNATLGSKALNRIFPTGDYVRSIDVYRVGYTDPWFAPGFLDHWLRPKTQFTLEAAFTEEWRNIYLLRRRRIQTALDWGIGEGIFFQAGWRLYDRINMKPTPGSNISNEDLFLYSKFPAQAIVNGPYFQVVRDKRDKKLDPTSGTLSVLRMDFANQLFGSSTNASHIKVDLRHQWNWAVGDRAKKGVVSLGVRTGAIFPTGKYPEELPPSERFFAGGPGSHRGVEPDALGVIAYLPALGSPSPTSAKGLTVPVGGQGIVLINLDYRFPLINPWFWGEVFVDSGQVYYCLNRLKNDNNPNRVMDPDPRVNPFPGFRTSVGLGLIFKLGVPIKVEYAWDIKRLLGKPLTPHENDTRLKGLLISAGFQF